MSDTNMQNQIDAINQKLDIVLEEIQLQKQKREEMEDLVTDLSIVGKDAFKATVEELDKAGVELDTEALAGLVFKVIRNIDMLNDMFNMLESFSDLLKDMGPIVHQVGLDAAVKMQELDQKGYFEFIREGSKVVDKVVTSLTIEDIRNLSDNIVLIMETVKNMTQPDMLRAMDNAVSVYHHMEMENIPEYSIWKAMREIRSPEMKKGIGFIMTFLKNLAKEKNN